jgi:hypothetical protein
MTDERRRQLDRALIGILLTIVGWMLVDAITVRRSHAVRIAVLEERVKQLEARK